MGDEFDADDDLYRDLLARLRDAGQLETVPIEAVASVKAAFVWRTIDEELARLAYDSSVDEPVGAGVRAARTASRLLTFETPTLTVEVEAVTTGVGRRLVGQLFPPQAGEAEARHAAGTATVRVDELGRFTIDDVRPGPVSLRCRGANGVTRIVTDWVVV
jgi:hypothetical protein